MSKTEENPKAAFIGESQARNKYTYFAQMARKEGYHYIAKIFEETAENEKYHALEEFKLLYGDSDTLPKTRYLMVPNSCDTINVPCSHIENYYCPPDPPPPPICCIIPLQPKAVLNCSFRACSFNRRIMKVYNRNQTSGILPKQQPEANLH